MAEPTGSIIRMPRVIDSMGMSTTTAPSQRAVTDALTDSITYPVGAPIPWPQSTPPSGYLVCNGQAFDKTTYPLLAQAYPSGFLPDLRGEFIRGWDDGRGVDAGRELMSSQGFAMEPTIGSATGFGLLSASSSSGALGLSPSAATQEKFGGTADNKKFYDLYLDNRGTAQTANETRPRNIAFNYIVRAA